MSLINFLINRMINFIMNNSPGAGGGEGVVRGDGGHHGGDGQPRGRDPARAQLARTHQAEVPPGLLLPTTPHSPPHYSSFSSSPLLLILLIPTTPHSPSSHSPSILIFPLPHNLSKSSFLPTSFSHLSPPSFSLFFPLLTTPNHFSSSLLMIPSPPPQWNLLPIPTNFEV